MSKIACGVTVIAGQWRSGPMALAGKRHDRLLPVQCLALLKISLTGKDPREVSSGAAPGAADGKSTAWHGGEATASQG